jgi:hypothetical protein
MYDPIDVFRDRQLIVHSQEPAPKKKAKSKNPQRTSQYGGAGSFIPFDSSPNRSHTVSRNPSTGSDLDQSAFGDANSSLPLDLYQAPYEKRASSTNLSSVDGFTKEFNNLGVSDVRPRRDTFPVRLIVYEADVELHIRIFSPSTNLLGLHQSRDSNTKPSTVTGTMNKIKELYSLSPRTINMLTRTRSRPRSRPLFNNNNNNHGDHGTVFPIPRVPQVSWRPRVSLP